ncbi:sigma-70 family RNA polymerase sigma factor [Pleionea sp. CnH1-48]|uniref:sigma-70 family RNA polymerase sigma factor n=1 Tax=Pleionea sp. CnH1-48 TaxID=2954494 RepID=UPI002096C957|nr:sigma-70 family RNA polymerase sigma factor [Pleionea sp. CnH1-48]MCO7226041.1 sigma-70 family RNA polymerase sigma factor [Pleionea sp. CnH1-48]
MKSDVKRYPILVSDNDGLSQYTEAVARYPLLSAAEEQQLFRKLTQLREGHSNSLKFLSWNGVHHLHSIEAVEALAHNMNKLPELSDTLFQPSCRECHSIIESIENRIQQKINTIAYRNLRLVIRIAKEHNFLKLPLMDLIQEGNIGLLKAIDRYDLDKDTRFSTYAWWWIKQSITAYVRRQGSLVRKSEKVVDDMLLLLRQFQTPEDYSNSKKRSEAKKSLGFSEEKINQLFKCALPDQSLDQENRYYSTGSFIDTLPSKTRQPDDLLITKKMLVRHISKLPKRLQVLVIMRYGLKSGETLSYREISTVIGLSTERTRQLEKEALYLLKNSMTLNH